MSASTSKSLLGLIKKAQSAEADVNIALENFRAEIEALKEQRQGVLSLPSSLDVVTGRAESWLAAVVADARKRAPDLSVFMGGSAHYREPEVNEAATVVVLLAPLLGEALAKSLAETHSQRESIPEGDRRERLASLDRRILNAEISEENVIRAALQAGLPVVRRRDADPRALRFASEEI